MGLKANSLPLAHVAHSLFKFITNSYYLHNIGPSVCVGVEQLEARTKDFHEILVIFRKKFTFG